MLKDIAPETDERAKIGPRDFLVCFIMGFTGDSKTFSLESMRRLVISKTGESIERSTFWERLKTKRLYNQLTQTLTELNKNLSQKAQCDNGVLNKIGVSGISIFDSTITSLYDNAQEDFNATFTKAGIKCSLEVDLFTGAFNWAQLTPSSIHDSLCFPDIKSLAGKLSLLDLGYFDLQRFSDMDALGAYFLSRAKSNSNFVIDEVVMGIGKHHAGKNLKDIKFKNKRGNIIEFRSTKKVGKERFSFRVIGFWNAEEKKYHWYITNLKCNAKLISNLYKLRWQIELLFKSAKRSLNMDQIPSANPMIILNLFIARMIAILIAMQIRYIGKANMLEELHSSISFQRSAMILTLLVQDIINYLLELTADCESVLNLKIKVLIKELVDPNRKNRSTSIGKVENQCT